MNDGRDPYPPDPYGQEPQVYGYDAYGRPIYQQPPATGQQYDPYGHQVPQGYDPYAQPQQEAGYDPYGSAVSQPPPVPPGYDDPYAAQRPQQYQPQRQPQQAARQQVVAPAPQDYPPLDGTGQQPTVPAQRDRDGAPTRGERRGDQHRSAGPGQPGQGGKPGGRSGPAGQSPDGPYRTEEFSFLEEPDEESEDVIDWLKFAETRTERRDERKRKARNRVVALVVVLALAVVGGVGYLWYAGRLPGLSGGGAEQTASGGPQQRDVIVVHLRETRGGATSTVLLVDNATTKKGTTVLLPNALAVSTEEGMSTTLGKSVEDEGADATRDALGSLLGSKIEGSWRLDTPYLENLVELVGGITLDVDVTVPAAKEGEDPLVKEGEDQALNGQAAVAYATHRGLAEAQTKQLSRFGQVMHAVLRKLSSNPDDATITIESLAQIPDPSLTEKELGATLAGLAEQAKTGAYDTVLLPVQQDGTLSQRATDHVVEDILGGTLKNTDQGAAPRVSVRNASGDEAAASTAQVALVNGGFTVVAAGNATGDGQPASSVTYADARHAAQAKEVAKTLGLSTSAVSKGKGASNADVTVVLGQDYKSSAG